MTNSLDSKRIFIFLGFAFGIAWLAGLALYLTGGLTSPYAFYLMAVVYMGAPALANVLTRLLTHEGWRNAWIRPYIKRSWRWWLLAWFGPALLIGVGMLVYYLLFPQHFDPSMKAAADLLASQSAAAGVDAPQITPQMLMLVQGLQAVLLAPIINALFTFGEEFGWRAYLLQKLLPLGGRRAALLMGLIWGLWHAPVIAMGHNYGLEYAGAPWLGIVAMTWFTTMLGILMAWVVLKARSVWPAVIIHGAVNGTAGIVVFMTQGSPNLILGPAIAGFIGGIGVAIAALLVFFSPRALEAPAENIPAAHVVMPTAVEVIPPAI